MEILESRPYGKGEKRHVLSGGVSLGSQSKIKSLPQLPTSLDALLRRPNLSEITGATGGKALRTSDKILYDFVPPKSGEALKIVAKGTNKLRGADAELKPGAFEFHFTRTGSDMRVGVTANEKSIGDLRVVAKPGAKDIDVLFTPSSVEYGRVYSKTLSLRPIAGSSREGAGGGRPDVRRAIEFEGKFYVEPVEAPGPWLKISPEGPRARLDRQRRRYALSRSIGPRGIDTGRWNVAFVARETVAQELRQ